MTFLIHRIHISFYNSASLFAFTGTEWVVIKLLSWVMEDGWCALEGIMRYSYLLAPMLECKQIAQPLH